MSSCCFFMFLHCTNDLTTFLLSLYILVTKTEMKLFGSKDVPPSSKVKSDRMSLGNEGSPSSPTKKSFGKAILSRSNSYQRGTESSKAKTLVNQDSGTMSPKRHLKGRGKLNQALKNKFKSTPDLVAADEENDTTMIHKNSSKTTEDLPVNNGGTHAKTYRRSMPATKLDKKDPFGLNEPIDHTDVVNRRSSHDTHSAHDSQNYQAFTLPRENKFLEKDPLHNDSAEKDKVMMPPPTTDKVLSNRQDAFVRKAANSKPTPQSNLTLAEAKAILLGKSSANLIPSKSGTAESGFRGNISSTSSSEMDQNSELDSRNSGRRARTPSPTKSLSKADVARYTSSSLSNSREELDELPVKERSIPRARNRQEKGEGDEPREGSPELITAKKSLSSSGVYHHSSGQGSLSSVSAPKQIPSNMDVTEDADSPGSSYKGSDDELDEIHNQAAFSLSSEKERSHSLPPSTKGRGKIPSTDSDMKSTLHIRDQPVKVTSSQSHPKQNRSHSIGSVLHSNQVDTKFSYGSLDRKGKLSSNISTASSNSQVSYHSKTDSDNSVDILGNFVKKSNSYNDMGRESLSPPKKDTSNGDPTSENDSPKHSVKSRISTWEGKSPTSSPANGRRRSSSPIKSLSGSKMYLPKKSDAPPPPRPNKTPLPPPPVVSPNSSPRTSPEKPQRSLQKPNDVESPTRGTPSILNVKDDTVKDDTAESIDCMRGSLIETPSRPNNFNATFTMSSPSPYLSTVTKAEENRPSTSGIDAKLREQKAEIQDNVLLSSGYTKPSTLTVEGEGDEDEVKRPDKTQKYPATSLTASPPQQVKG